MNSHIRAVLFDLDGTLADTAPDLGAALNRLLIEEGHAPQPYAAIRPLASHGARGLIELGFGITPSDPEFCALRERFLDFFRVEAHEPADDKLEPVGGLDRALFLARFLRKQAT